MNGYQTYKRLLDMVLSAAGIIVCLPIMSLVALGIRIDSKGPVIHKASRLGREGKSFTKYKFRTMIPNGEEELKKLLHHNPELKEEYNNNYKIVNDPRTTRLGRFLRKYSLDELPQFYNVIKGDMSLVGPRDIIDQELEDKYADCKDKLLSVKPGLSGWWQVNGRSKLPYEERVRLDMYYIDNISFKLDLLILLKTPLVVLRGDDVE